MHQKIVLAEGEIIRALPTPCRENREHCLRFHREYATQDIRTEGIAAPPAYRSCDSRMADRDELLHMSNKQAELLNDGTSAHWLAQN